MRAAGRQHLFGLRGVVRHPRLAEHVLAGRERGRGELEMAVGPGADADGVDGRDRRAAASTLSETRGMPYSVATASPLARERLTTLTISTSSISRKPGMCRSR